MPSRISGDFTSNAEPSREPNNLFRDARIRLFGTQEQLAEAINLDLPPAYVVTANEIGKIERGIVKFPRPVRRVAYRKALQAATDAEIGFFNSRRGKIERTPVLDDPLEVQPLDGSPGEESSTWTVDWHPELDNESDMKDSEVFLSAMHSFRAADKKVGGSFLYDTVVRYLRTEVEPKVADTDQTSDSEVFLAAATMTEMVGWMAHDAGRDEVAVRHFSRSLDLAESSNDEQLGVHIFGSISHLANHLGRVPDAMRYAQQGQALLARIPRQPDLEARLFSVQARSYAALGDKNECVRLIEKADKALQAVPGAARSQWASNFDAGSLAGEAARCFRILGDADRAQRYAEKVVELRPETRTRSHAFGQLILIAVLIRKGHPEQACELAGQLLTYTDHLSSNLVTQQLRELRVNLDAYKASRTVAGFIVRLDEALRKRAWLYRWPKGRGEQPAIGYTGKW
jgi:tetratricopeptide (TPR) repeat protein